MNSPPNAFPNRLPLGQPVQRLLHLRLALAAATLVAGALGRPLFSILTPVWPLLLVAAGWLMIGAALHLQAQRATPVSSHLLFAMIALDVVMLTVQLALSGGPASPLTALYLPLMVAAAALLPQRKVWQVLLLVTAGYASLWWLSLPLVVEDAERATQMHLIGMWATFILSAVLVAGPLAHISRTLRRRERELATAQQATLAAERVAALGAQAAGAAHELGTPLNTIALLAEEIRAGEDAAARNADVATLLAQVARCKEIIAQMLADAGVSRAGAAPLPIRQWLDGVCRRFRLLHPECTVHIDASTAGPLLIAPDVALTQGITNLLQNAADASPQAIHLSATRQGRHIVFSVRDAGAGFNATALTSAGRTPYSDKPQGMGMGLLLTATAAERLGGRLQCRNRPEGGAEVLIDLPLEAIAVESTHE